MSLNVGSRLAHYDVTALIGEGGMGQVYQATDTQLGREVALKVLPDAFTADPDRLARFEREAKVLASLNHPNIGAIYGLEKSGDTRALVLELIEGPTLADRIKQGPIPLDEALPIAKQIAEALEAAHEKGVIHRDLKPANIKVRDDGTVKVLDFGLAKALDPSPEGDPAQSPTLTAMATQMGVIMGTAAYMSPEQARGKTVDKRADIWSFGVVLYEMLTGTRAFEGDDVSLTLADVMRAEPAWERLPHGIPFALRTYLACCLAKDPLRRVRDIGDVRLALEGTFDAPAVPTPHAATSNTFRWERIGWGAAVALALLAAFVEPGPPAPMTSAPRTARLAIVPTGEEMAYGFALSSDGQRVAYAAIPPDGGLPLLWVRGLEDAAGRELRGTEGAQYPFWSPDGSSIGFFAGGEVKRVGRDGGAVQALCAAPARPRGGSWNQDDVIIFAGWAGPMQRVPATGGEPVVVRAPDATHEEVSLTFPRFLPDRQRYLYHLRSREGDGLYLASLDGREPERRILELAFASRAEYVEPGYLVYKDRSEILVAQSVDPETLTATGTPVPVSQEVVANPFAWSAFSVSARTLIFQAQSQVGDSDNRLQWVDRGGNIVETLGQDGNYWRLAVSQDGRRVATTEGSDIWLYEAAGNPTRITSHLAIDTGATWAPDNRRIAFTSFQNGAGDIFVKDVASTEDGDLVVSATGANLRAADWSRDGQFLMLTRIGDTSPSEDIWVHSFVDGTTEPVIQTRFNERHPQLSPDSRWLAYTSEEAGQPNVYVSSFPGPGPARRVSPSGGHQPRWRGDGGELYYLAPDHSLMAVAVSGEHELVTAPPERLFQMDTHWASSGVSYGYDVTPDGDRFLTISRSGFASLSVVLNWRADLEAPTN